MNPASIGRYVIKSEIASGGMATVFLAFDPNVKREVAIKLLPANLTHDSTFRSRFEREAQTVASLEYPAIVPVYDFGEENGQPYLVMRYMPGGSLAQRIKSNPLSLMEISRMYTRLSSALDHVHAMGIIHRDLKPANILFDLYNNAYLSDFGIAHITQGNAALTGDGMVGTPAYMSPEQARGDKNLDGRSDIYSMGAILFEAITGKQPFEAATPMGIAVKHLTEPIPKLSDYIVEIPPQCQDVIDMSMAKDINQRFQSVASLAQALMLIATKTIKNQPAIEEEPTERISPIEVKVPHHADDRVTYELESLPTTLPPQFPDPSNNELPSSPVQQPGSPVPVSVAKPFKPRKVSPQPVITPLPPVPASEDEQPNVHSGPPLWLWILVVAIGFSAICLLIAVVFLLTNFWL